MSDNVEEQVQNLSLKDNKQVNKSIEMCDIHVELNNFVKTIVIDSEILIENSD